MLSHDHIVYCMEVLTGESLKPAAWEHASPCGKCHTGWEKCGGGNRIFLKKFERLCHSPLMFSNLDVKTIDYNCSPEDFFLCANKVVISKENQKARAYLRLPFSCGFKPSWIEMTAS